MVCASLFQVHKKDTSMHSSKGFNILFFRFMFIPSGEGFCALCEAGTYFSQYG